MKIDLPTLCCIGLLFASIAGSLSAQTRIDQRFAQLLNSPPELYAFLYKMPKGADLHNHLTGAIYAEAMVETAAQDSMCLDEHGLAIAKASAAEVCSAAQMPATRAAADNQLFNGLVNSLSMRDFQPGAESAHDHFFATFLKFDAVTTKNTGKLMAAVVQRAAAQNESYLELMAVSGGAASAFGKRVGFDTDFETTAKKLTQAGISEVVSTTKARLDQTERDVKAALACQQAPDSPACKLVVHYIFQVLRETPRESAFAQILAGFMLASTDERVVGVNLVQPEDGIISMRDYSLHMRMVEYAKKLYPNVHVTLHAGELASGLVPPEGLRFHIREAVEIGQAERIGHGVSVMYESDATELLARMSKRHVAVEVNLTSNDAILGIKGNDHPFPIYRKYHVPVVLSTDDEGVSRTHLTQEYQRAVLTYRLNYADVKEIVRNSIEHSFLSGASYWSGGGFRVPAAACLAGVQAARCQAFLAGSEKARLQLDLERRFDQFEKSF